MYMSEAYYSTLPDNHSEPAKVWVVIFVDYTQKIWYIQLMSFKYGGKHGN